MTKPRIGIIPGDPGGIGPELIAKLLSQPDIQEKADILLIGDAHLFALGQQQAGCSYEMQSCDPLNGERTEQTSFAHYDRETISED